MIEFEFGDGKAVMELECYEKFVSIYSNISPKNIYDAFDTHMSMLRKFADKHDGKHIHVDSLEDLIDTCDAMIQYLEKMEQKKGDKKHMAFEKNKTEYDDATLEKALDICGKNSTCPDDCPLRYGDINCSEKVIAYARKRLYEQAKKDGSKPLTTCDHCAFSNQNKSGNVTFCYMINMPRRDYDFCSMGIDKCDISKMNIFSVLYDYLSETSDEETWEDFYGNSHSADIQDVLEFLGDLGDMIDHHGGMTEFRAKLYKAVNKMHG